MSKEGGRRSSLKNRFTAGELSPKTYDRTDLTRYQTGLKTCLNMKTLPQGGVESRSGTKFVAEVKDSSTNTRLIDFQFNTTETYVIEIGHLYMRFYSGTSQIRESAKTITGITAANPAVVTSNSHGYSNGDHIYLSDISGMTELNSETRRYTVANQTANTFELSGINSTSYTAYTSGGSARKVYQIATKYTSSEIDGIQIKYTQSADTLFLVHKNHTPYKLTRTGDTAWVLTPLMKDGDETGATLLISDGPYLNENTTATTITPSGGAYTPGSTPTLTASSITGINAGAGFQTTDVGRLIRVYNGTAWAWAEIVTRTSTTVVTATVKGTISFPSTAQTRWQLGAWSETTGFPSSVTFFEDRLALASTNGTYDAQPDTFWLSVTGDYLNFAPGTAADSDAINLTLGSQNVNAIQWLASHKTLRIGTAGATYNVTSSSNSASLTPTDNSGKRATSSRCSGLQPILVDNRTIFWDASQLVLHDMQYVYTEDEIKAPAITKVSEHISKGGVIASCLEQVPNSIIWSVREDGVLLGCTYQPEDEIIGWHRHIIGGTDVAVKSICSIPTTRGNDRTWLVVSRTIGGSTKQYIEYITDVYDPDWEVYNTIGAPELAVFADSAFTYSGYKPTTTLTPAAITGNNITFTAGASVFSATDVGRRIRSGIGVAIIKTYTNATTVSANVVSDFASTSAIASQSWSLSVAEVGDLWHLEGETVKVLKDGGTHQDKVVSNGRISLQDQSTYVTIGLSYTRAIDLLDIDEGTPFGSGLGAKSQINKAVVDVLNSVGFKIGSSSSDARAVQFRRTDNLMGIGIPIYSGLVDAMPFIGFTNEFSLYIEQTDPLPLTIRAINLKGVINDTI